MAKKKGKNSSGHAPIKAPVAVYIVHHPECDDADKLAGSLFKWFRLGHLSSCTGGAGLPVFFRRQLSIANSRGDGDSIFEPKIDYTNAELNVVIVLVDHKLVFDADWRKAVIRLAEEKHAEQQKREKLASNRKKKSAAKTKSKAASQTRTLLLPAALHDSFYRLEPLYDHFNPIRLLKMDLPAKVATIRRAATEATSRELRRRQQAGKQRNSGKQSAADAEPKPLSVFLSHAKRDGIEIAKKIRDEVRNFGQMVAWYDANDLPLGGSWNAPMKKAVKEGTAAMVASVTDAYPTRPWCRQEAKLARTPQRIEQDSQVWKVRPVVAVHQPKLDWVRGVPMLDGVPRIGWDAVKRDADIGRIFDRLVLELLLHLVHRRIAEQLDQMHGNSKKNCFISWVPDAWTLSKLRELSDSPEEIERIVYPGYELTTSELADLRPAISSFNSKAELKSFDELWDSKDDKPNRGAKSASGDSRPAKPRGLFIALATGGQSRELAAKGVGVEHVNELMVQISRRLLADGHRLAYGGTLGFKKENQLTESLIDTALSWYADLSSPEEAELDDSQKKSIDLNDPDTWPLTNHSAWPFYKNISKEKRAELVGICRIIDIKPKYPSAKCLDTAYDNWNGLEKAEQLTNCPAANLLIANSLSRMRERCSRETDLRIVWGGKIEGAAGWMAGILEEVMYSLQFKKPVLIFGSLGGCAGILAEFLADESQQEWPYLLSLEASANESRDKIVSKGTRLRLTRRFEKGKRLIRNYRSQIHRKGSSFGISNQIFRQALLESSQRKMLELVTAAASQRLHQIDANK